MSASIIPDLFYTIDNQHLNRLSTHLIHYPFEASPNISLALMQMELQFEFLNHQDK